MKKIYRRWSSAVIFVTLAVLLSACGQAGKLYLPSQAQPVSTRSI